MRKEIVSIVQAMLTASGAFAKVAGIRTDRPLYPLARVWIPGSTDKPIDTLPQALLDLRVAVQVETAIEMDADGNSLEGPLYDLVDAVFSALHAQFLPGVKSGAHPLIVFDSPGIGEFNPDGATAYLLQVSVRVVPAAFTLL